MAEIALRDSLARRLRRSGLRVTPQRLAVLEYLTSTEDHPSAERVGQALSERMAAVSRASVYNVLHSLCSAGLVREVMGQDAVTRYDGNLEPHHHFLCRACGRIEDLPWDSARISGRPPGAGRTVESFEVVYRGRCVACAGPASG